MKLTPLLFATALLGLIPMARAAESAAPARLPVIDFEEYDLPNGLHVILHRDTTAPVISTYVLYHVGSKNEQPDRTGFAHFFEHLMFEGSENIPRGQIDKLVSAAGGNLNASTSFDRTDYHFNLPSNQLPLALWIESERMLHAKVEKVGVETQRQVVKEERRRGTDNAPFGTVFENLAAQVFDGTPYAWTPIGSAQYIDQAKLEEFQAFYHRYYLPNNATLAVAGDFDLAQAKQWIADYFGPIPKGPAIERPAFQLPPQTEPKSREVALRTTPLPATLHSWRGPEMTSPDAPALELLTNILATGRSSRMYEELVRQAQVASDVDVFPFLLENGGVLGVFVVGNPDASIPKLDELVTAEVAKVRDSGVTEEELQKAKNGKLKALASAYGAMQHRAESLAQFHAMYGDTAQINHQWERYEKVTTADLQRVARTYFTPQGVNVLHYPVVSSNSSNANASK
jgi:predicted Zn-dependent peptidase